MEHPKERYNNKLAFCGRHIYIYHLLIIIRSITAEQPDGQQNLTRKTSMNRYEYKLLILNNK